MITLVMVSFFWAVVHGVLAGFCKLPSGMCVGLLMDECTKDGENVERLVAVGLAYIVNESSV